LQADIFCFRAGQTGARCGTGPFFLSWSSLFCSLSEVLKHIHSLHS
jgi:hypothetical protein